VKARIWKDREDGAWRFAVRNSAGDVFWAGSRAEWGQALSLVLAELYPPWPLP